MAVNCSAREGLGVLDARSADIALCSGAGKHLSHFRARSTSLRFGKPFDVEACSAELGADPSLTQCGQPARFLESSTAEIDRLHRSISRDYVQMPSTRIECEGQ